MRGEDEGGVPASSVPPIKPTLTLPLSLAKGKATPVLDGLMAFSVRRREFDGTIWLAAVG